MIIVLAIAIPASGRSRKGRPSHLAAKAVQPLDGSLDFSAVDLALGRDGSGAVGYDRSSVGDSPMFAPGNGALFDDPLAIEKCDGDWACAKQTKAGAHWEMQSRNDDTGFCDFPVVSADELTAEYFEEHFKDRFPVLIRKAPGGKEPFRNKAVKDLLNRKGLTESFGPHPASVGNSLEIVHQSGSGGLDMNIGEFVRAFMGKRRPHYKGEPLYIFQRGVVGDDLLTPTCAFPLLVPSWPPLHPFTVPGLCGCMTCSSHWPLLLLHTAFLVCSRPSTTTQTSGWLALRYQVSAAVGSGR
jgi:hypothetical protein